MRSREDDFTTDARALAETLPVIVWHADASGAYDYFSADWYAYTGISEEACAGNGWLACVHPDDADRAANAWRIAIDVRLPLDAEFRVRRRDGAYRWFLSRGQLQNDDDPASAWLGACVDIDDQKRMELQFRTIAEVVPQMVFTTLADGAVEYVNAVMYEYSGKPPASLTGWSWLDVIHPDDVEHYVATWRTALERGDRFEVRVRMLRRDGDYRWFLTRAVAVRDPSTGVIARWFGTGTDVHELSGAAVRNAFVARAEDLFASELDSDAILRAVVGAAVVAFADYCFVDLASDDGTLERAVVEHRDPRRREAQQRSIGERIPMEHLIHPVATAWRSGESVLVPRIDESWWRRAAASEAQLNRMREEEVASLICVVLAARGRRFGVLTFCRNRGAASYSESDLATAEDLARRIGPALENARLYQEARAAAETQRRIAEREAFYARLGDQLSRTLDLRTTLDTATRLLVPDFADWAVVNLVDADDELYLASTAHRDAALEERARPLLGSRYIARRATTGSAQVARSNRPLLSGNVPSRNIEGIAEPYRATVRQFGVTSSIVVPVAFGGIVRGTIAVMYDRTSGREYSDDDVPVMVEVARRIAPAIGNAEAYERERRVARTFQAAALTTELPRVPGMAFDALYEAGRSEALLGGDWYDAFRLPDGRIVVSVGDVAGSGLDAAATMAAIRQSLRGVAAIDADPSVMLDAADRVLRSQTRDRFVTAWVGVLDPLWETLVCAGAGHPPPLRRLRDGSVDALPGGGLPLGLRERGQDGSQRIALAPGTTFLLYTDGLVEAGRDLLAGELAVIAALAEADITAAPAKSIHDAVLGNAGAIDDVALLVVAYGESLSALGGGRGARHWRFDAADGEVAAAVRAEIAAALAARDVSPADGVTAELIFTELVGNAQRHAPGQVDVALDLSGEQPVLHVVDGGGGFRHNARLPADALAESGRGLYIVASFADEFAVSRAPSGGAHVRAVLRGRLRQPSDA
ncbi:MAG TPA: SpoIIE family protein phosphatase [Candidatus Sulfotelmatobacter sp.]|nr:SpoIIE family protein phosphatase [Candidatus Sulfotelmatobacter sp.]